MIPFIVGAYGKYLIEGSIVNQRKWQRDELEKYPVEK